MVTLKNGFIPETIEEALQLRATENVIPYAGGTDLMVNADENARYLFLNQIRDFATIDVQDNVLIIGAGCTYTELLHHDAVPAILKDAMRLIASPGTRNMATPAGNICNASPKADSALIFVAADATLRLQSINGDRIVPIAEFFTGRGKTVLRDDELLTEIRLPLVGLDNYYYQKIGARAAMAISRVSFVGIFNEKDGRITRIATAFGAVSDTILRFPEFEAMLIGKTKTEASALKDAFLTKYDKAIVPIRGRVSADYRKTVCMNLLRDFLAKNGI